MEEVTTTEELLEQVSDEDLEDLCDAAESAILDGGGFGWLTPPPRVVLSRYFRGVILVPERHLFVGRLDGRVVASAQLQEPPSHNEAQAHLANLTAQFVAPWARGRGISRDLVRAIEDKARSLGYMILQLDVRETQVAALHLYDHLGYERWGSYPDYALVDGKMVTGHYYAKRLRSPPSTRKRKARRAAST